MDDTPFKREDIVTLQDPHKVDDEINTFYHIKMGLGKRAPEAIAADGGGLNASAVKGNGELSCSSQCSHGALAAGMMSRILEQNKKQSFDGKAAPGINRVVRASFQLSALNVITITARPLLLRVHCC